MNFAIETRDLSKQFKNVSAVKNLTLKINRGEVFGLIGPDGAGKTTTLRMLTGILTPSSGSGSIAGYDLNRDTEKIKEHIGYMSQRFSLYPDLTVSENLDFFAEIHNVPKPEKNRKKTELLEFARLTAFTKRKAQNLSGGMKQKLALACTLIHTPEVLFLDEPTTGVDPVSRQEFWKIILGLSGRVTILVTTPYMDEAEKCSRIGLIQAGSLMLTDTPENIKGIFQDELLEVICSPQRVAKLALREIAQIKNIVVFGDRLHIIVPKAAEIESQVRILLTKHNVSVSKIQKIPPSLEDVFVWKAAQLK